MEKSIKISIVRPGKAVLTTEASHLVIPAWNGEMGIFYNRLPLMSTMAPGLITLTNENGKKSFFATTGGFAEVENNKVTLLCDSLITQDTIPEDEQSKRLLEKIKNKIAQQ